MVDAASNRIEYQDVSPVDKGGQCLWLMTLPPSCADCLSRNSGGLNLLEHEGPVQVSKRIALPLLLPRKTESLRCKLCILNVENLTSHCCCEFIK